MNEIDPAFRALPLRGLADAALSEAAARGVSHADVRVGRSRSRATRLRDARLQGINDEEDTALGVRVVHDGSWGFAATGELTPTAAAAATARAVEMARVTRPAVSERVELAPQEPLGDVTWVSAYDLDPFSVAPAEMLEVLAGWSAGLLAAPGVDHVDAALLAVRENTFYADLTGSVATQQRVRVHPVVTIVAVDRGGGGFETMRSLAPPAGRGQEYLTGTGWDWAAELAELPELLTEKVRAPRAEAGTYDLVIDPTNLWLTIHESVGHATELDRALGYEAAYAGTTFATPEGLGRLRYGSPVMHVTGDRTTPHGLATVGYDDEGVPAQRWDLVRDGVLVGYQLDRRTARLAGLDRSNGCAYADSAARVPLQRMANVSLQPAADGPSTEELVAGVERGIYVVGDKSWSIDMQRHNFQFTGQRFYRIAHGRLAGQVRDLAYQGSTTEFWGSLEAVGGPETYLLGGAFNCGKGQPGQLAPVSHGCPSALFRSVTVLATSGGAGR